MRQVILLFLQGLGVPLRLIEVHEIQPPKITIIILNLFFQILYVFVHFLVIILLRRVNYLVKILQIIPKLIVIVEFFHKSFVFLDPQLRCGGGVFHLYDMIDVFHIPLIFRINKDIDISRQKINSFEEDQVELEVDEIRTFN